MTTNNNTNPHLNPTATNLSWRLRHNELTELYVVAISNGNWKAVDHYERKLDDHMKKA